MRRHLFSRYLFSGAVALWGFCLAAHADTIYNLTLTSSDGFAGGSGSFALNVPPPSTGVVAYSFNGTAPYTVGDKIDSFAFTYTPPPGGYSVTSLAYGPTVVYIQFTNGALSALSGFNYLGGSPSCQSQLGIGLTSYNYTEGCHLFPGFPTFYNDAGTVTITPAAVTGATPEPSGVVLLGTGMLGVLGVVRRRFLRQDEGVSYDLV